MWRRSKRLLRVLALFAVTLVVSCVAPLSAFAKLDDKTLKFYAGNDIIYYDSTYCQSNDSGGSVVSGEAAISGSEAAEKVWSGLKSLGLSDEVAAGIMGNMYHEGNAFNPAQHEGSFYSQWESFKLDANEGTSYGIGLIQWSFTRRINLYNYIKSKSPGLLKYLDNPKTYSYANGNAYGVNGDKFLTLADSEADADALISLELTFLVNEELKTIPAFSGIFNQTTVEGATDFFLERVEVPANIEGTRPGRRKTAQEVFASFSGKSSFGASSTSTTAVDGNKVTVIGDSITDGSKGVFSSKLAGSDVHSQVSKHFKMNAGANAGGEGGLTILKQLVSEGKLREVLVFALGTNDNDSIGASEIQEVIDTAKGVSRIVFVTNYEGGKVYENTAAAFKKAAADNPSLITVADWATAVKDEPSKYLYNDNTHPNSDGQDLFVELIIRAISGAASYNANSASANYCMCTDTSSVGNSSGDSFAATGYDLSDAQLKGLLAIAKAENGVSISGIKMEASIMANLFEFKEPKKEKTADNLVNYVRTGGWFSTGGMYDESYSNYTQEEFDAIKDVLKNGNRIVPTQILEHDAITDLEWIEVEGTKYTSLSDFKEFSNYKSGKTKIHNKFGSTYIFYIFANPEGTKVGIDTGDPFGYFENDPPSQTSGGTTNTAKSSVTWTDGWITAGMEGYNKDDAASWHFSNGHVENGAGSDFTTTSPKGGTGPNKILLHNTEGWISDPKLTTMGETTYQPSSGNNYVASPPHFTINIRDKKVYQHFSINKTSASLIGDQDAGVQIEIMGFGDTSTLKDSRDALSKAGNFSDDNWDYLAELLIAISAETQIPLTTSVEWGHNVARLSEEEFKNYSGILGHKHAPRNDHTDPEGIWDYIKAALERAGAFGGTGVGGNRDCEVQSSTGLRTGGMSLSEAQAFMQEYHDLMEAHQGKTSFSVTTLSGATESFSGVCCGNNNGGVCNVMKNCVSFSWWFLRKYVDYQVPTTLGNGKFVVGTLKGLGFPTGNQPRPYAIFSWSDAQTGHTGVVLGVVDENTFIVGEASCGANHKDSWAVQAAEKKLNDGHDWTFAYTDDWIKF